MPFAAVQSEHLGTTDGQVGRSSGRIRRLIALSSVGMLVFAGCGGSDGSSDDSDDVDDGDEAALLRVRYENPDAGIEADYTISCDATATLSGDDVTVDAEDACDALDDSVVVDRLVEPPTDRVCTEVYGGADTAEIGGTINESAVETTVDRTNGCGIGDWDDVLDALLPPAVGASDVTTSSNPPTTSPTSSSTSTSSPSPTSSTSTTTTVPATTSTTMSTTTTTMAAAPTGLTAWPAPPTPASLADLPYLLPSGPIDEVTDGVREETERSPGDSDATVADYVQFWVSGDGGSQLTSRTHLRGEPVGSEEFRVPVEVSGWDSAFMFENTGSYSGVTLVGQDGFVAVEAYGIGQDTVVDLARSLSRRPGGEPGWELDALSTDLVPVHEGWSSGAMGTASREIDWFDADGQLEAELSIGIGQPGRFGQVWRPDFGAMFADVGGSQAMIVQYDYSATDAPTIVVWSPTENQVVQFGVVADPQRALEIARGIGPTSEEIWNSVARPPSAPRDGCNAFVC